MGLFDFLFGLRRAQPMDYLTSKTTAAFMKTAVIAQVVLAIGLLAKIGTVTTTIAMVCRNLIRMRIVIFNAILNYG